MEAVQKQGAEQATPASLSIYWTLHSKTSKAAEMICFGVPNDKL